MNNDNFLIEQDDIKKAQDICTQITDAADRNIAVANVFASNIAMKYFEGKEVDTESGLHNIPQVMKDIEISDIYINGSYIDVRLYVNDDCIFVPKSHFDMNILPVAYMFIKLDDNMSGGVVGGFIFPEDIDTSNDINGYYKIKENELVSYYDIEQRIITVDDIELPDNFEKNIYDYLDGNINDKGEFFRNLVQSKYAREILVSASCAKNILSQVTYDDSGSASGADVLPEDVSLDLDIHDDSDLSLTEYADTDLLEEAADINFAEDSLIVSDDSEMLLEESGNDELVGLNETTEDLINDADGEINRIDEFSELPLEPEEENIDAQIYEPSIDINEELPIADALPEAIDVMEESGIDIQPNIEEADAIIDDSANEVVDVPEEIQSVEEVSDSDNDDIAELSEFDYSTEITPSINSIEDESAELLSELEAADEMNNANNESETIDVDESIDENSSNAEQIDTLFGNENVKQAKIKKKKSSILPLLLLLLGASAVYFGYTKFYAPSQLPDNPNENEQSIETPTTVQNVVNNKDVAMPVETVENEDINKPSNEGTAVSIPAIEQNLGATIQVSNLSVNWEVPSSYTTNSTAKRYFMRIGKILQLNIKTELLLINASPITNKISVELEFDKGLNKFKIKQIVNSSGVAKIDDTIKDTVNKALNVNLNMNMGVFNNLQGNPVLVIKL